MCAFAISGVIQHAIASQVLTVEGRLITQEKTLSELPDVQLIKISMSDRPTVTPVKSVKPDKTGYYVIRYQPEATSEKVFYRVAIEVAGQTIGSDPFRLDPTKKTISVDLELPAVETGANTLEIPKEVLIFESLEGSLRMTTILFVVNRSTLMVDARKIPFEKPIHPAAFNFQQFGSSEGVELSVSSDAIEIGVAMAEGTRQIFFSYDIPVSSSVFKWDYPIIPGLQELELSTPQRETAIAIGSDLKTGYTLRMEEKEMGGRMFYSKIVSLNAPVNTVPVEISGFPRQQSRMLVPAIFLMALLMLGLVYFLVRKLSR